MKKIITTTLSACALATMLSATDTSPMYTNETALETKKIMMVAQITAKNFPAKVTCMTLGGKRGFFESMSENTDKNWEGHVYVDSEIHTCFSEEQLQHNEKAGYKHISHTADITTVSYREAVKELKEYGAKYLLVTEVPDDNNYTMYAGKSFADFFQGELTREYVLGNNLLVMTPSGTYTGAGRTMDDSCTEGHGSVAKELFWGVAKVASLALGAKGAASGNSSYAALSSGSEQALGSHAPESTEPIDYTKVSGMDTKNKLRLYGAVYKEHFDVRRGYVFSIADVEEHLAHYKVIPYKAIRW